MRRKRLFRIGGGLVCLLVVASIAWAATPQAIRYGLRFTDEGAAHSTPPSGYGDLYVNSDVLYFISDGGTVYDLITASSTFTSGILLDDNSGASPSLTFTDGTNETAVFAKADAGVLQLTTVAGDGLNILVGNLWVGNGTPGTASMNGEDAYIEGQLEVDGTVQLDGAVTTAGNVSVGGNLAVTGTTTLSGAIYQADIAAAASGNANLTLNAAGSGTISVGNVSTGAVTITPALSLLGNVTVGNAATDTLTITSIINSSVTLDDGTTDSPSWILKDATDQTATFVKVDNSHVTVTPGAETQSFQILTGNLSVGNGSPGVAAMDGEDFYVNGDSEFDGIVQFDGIVTHAAGVVLDDGTGASPSLTFQDATNETAVFSKADAGYLSITTVAGDGVSVLTGNLKVGGGSPGTAAMDGEDFYVTGDSEFDGAAYFHGAVTLGDAAGDTISLTGAVGTDLTFATGIAGGADISVAQAAADTAGSTLDLVAGAGGTAGAGQVGKNGAILSITGGAGSAKNGAGATDGDGGDVVLTGGARGGTTGGTEVQGIVRVGNPTVGATKTVDLLAVAGGLEVDGNIKADGNITGDGSTVLTGTVSTVTDGAAANPYTVTIAMCGNTFYNSQAIQFNLPEASTAIGCTVTFAVLNASNLDVNPDDADLLVGAASSAGDMIRSATVGDTVTLQAVSASQWIVKAMYPASTDWTDAN